MRRILVENARRTARRGAAGCGVDLPDVGASTQISPEDLLALDDALSRLAAGRAPEGQAGQALAGSILGFSAGSSRE